MVGIDGSAQGDDYLFGTGKLLHHLFTDRLKISGIHLSAGMFHVESFRFDAEYFFGILLVTEYHIAAGHQCGHDLRCFFAIFPEILPVVEVARYGHPHLIGSLNGFEAGIRRALRQCRSDTCPVEPGSFLQYLLPVEHPFFHRGDGGVCPVVYHFRGTGHSTCLEEVNPHAFSATENAGCSHIVFPQVGDAPFSDIVFR